MGTVHSALEARSSLPLGGTLYSVAVLKEFCIFYVTNVPQAPGTEQCTAVH